MKQINREDKVLWQVYCAYTHIPKETYETIGLWGSRTQKRKSKECWDYLHQYYYYCTQVWSVIDCNFKKFVDRMDNNGFKDVTHRWYNKPYRGYRRWWRVKDIFRQRIKYHKKPHYEKKILSAKKQDQKDRAKKKRIHKHKGIRSYHKSTGWKWHQVNANRKERRKVEQMLYHTSDWDTWTNPKRRECLDPWDFD